MTASGGRRAVWQLKEITTRVLGGGHLDTLASMNSVSMNKQVYAWLAPRALQATPTRSNGSVLRSGLAIVHIAAVVIGNSLAEANEARLATIL